MSPEKEGAMIPEGEKCLPNRKKLKVCPSPSEKRERREKGNQTETLIYFDLSLGLSPIAVKHI